MGIFDKFKKQENSISLEQLKREPYEQENFETCKWIWKNYVPKSGQASVLQGELLRELEKLRCEAQDNGNINWDSDFSHFCKFIKEIICSQTIYTDDEKVTIKLILSYLQECGEYAEKFHNGQIPDKELDVEKIAYVGDNLYDMVADAIGKLQMQHPDPIPFEKNGEIKR